MRSITRLWFALLCVVAMAGGARAQTVVKARTLVMVDSSGSMVWHFGDCANTNGDSGTAAVFCDNAIGTAFACNKNLACTIANGGVNLWPTTLANYSRLYAAKSALNNVIAGSSGSIDFGLSRYVPSTVNGEYLPGITICPDGTNCCSTQVNGTTRGRCIPQFESGYTNVPNSTNCDGAWVDQFGNPLPSNCNLTWIGGCGTSAACTNCTGTQGGEVLVQPAAGSSNAVLPWIDFTEDFCSSTAAVGGPPRNPELRADGSTPLAGSVRTARVQWYTPIYNVSKVGLPTYNPASPIFDNKLDCRPYVHVVMTDGGEDCEDQTKWFSDPQVAVQELTNVNVTNPVKTYVIGMSFAQNEPCNNTGADNPAAVCPKTGPTGGCSTVGGAQVCSCNSNADCGQTCDGFAYTCGADHVCHHPALNSLNAMATAGGSGTARFANNEVDIEAAFADIVASTVKIEKCNNADDDCDGACDEPFPDVAVTNAACSNQRAATACNNGALAGTHCYATGVFVCSADTLSEVCGAPTCATMPSLCPTAETCNGQDDDCNGVVDDCIPFVKGSCCTGKCPACNPTGVPQPETCNNCDDDCDGVIDNHLTDTGLACGSNVGDCSQGTTFCCSQAAPTPTNCTQSQTGAGDRLVCLGGTGPSAEVCDGTDHDCDGKADDVTQACFPFATGMAGVGICRAGVAQCTAAPCGTAPNVCCPAGWPSGKTCPGAAMYGACSGAVGPQAEVCNGVDDNCDGTVDNNVTDPWIGTACCPTGNVADCQNTGTGTRCKIGAYQCVGGAKVCVGGIAKSPETCNNVDDDCNGLVDDAIPGNGAPCTGAGILTQGVCQAQYECVAPKPGTGPNGLTCVQTVGPSKELCNGVDDDCNGTIDDNLMDPRVGVVGGSPCTPLVPVPGTMFPATGPTPPCNPGTTACVNGMVVCQGEVQPVADVCNGGATDCTGNPNSNGNCPSGFMCYMGMCAAPCGSGEFPCPGGFVCTGPPNNVCIPDVCAMKQCQVGFECQIDQNGNATCVDLCTKIMCPAGSICSMGMCKDDTCKTKGCPTGQVCNTNDNPAMCVPDPCFGVMCPTGQFCNNGTCQGTCSNCPAGEVCINGTCQADPCKGKTCPSGQVCTVMNGAGVCVANQCSTTGCNQGMACCGGSCRPDPCGTTQCPSGTVCKLDESCGPSCQTPMTGPTDQVVGAGGGGFSCSAAPGRAPLGSGFALLLFTALIVARLRRRSAPSNSEVRR